MKKLFFMTLFVALMASVLSAQNVVNGDPIVSGGYFVGGVQSFGIGKVDIVLKNGMGYPIGSGTANTFAGNAYVLGTLDVFYWGGSISDVKGIEVWRNGIKYHDFTFDAIPLGGFMGKNINVPPPNNPPGWKLTE